MKQMTIQQVKEKLDSDQLSEQELSQLEQDTRKGIQQLLQKWRQKKEKEQQLLQKFIEMTKIEHSLREKGFTYIAGVDEVGRGPLAGPVVAAAVILPEDFKAPGLNDSKQLTEKERDCFYTLIIEKAIAYGIGIVEAAEIDKLNIYSAAKKAMTQAVLNLKQRPDYVLIDAMELSLPIPQQSIIKGDEKSISIAASSVLAKVTRDNMMKEYSSMYPHYGFDKNMGYGTKEHLEALKHYGITPIHRRSFSPVQMYSGGNKDV